jgi:hypothetical protein
MNDPVHKASHGISPRSWIVEEKSLSHERIIPEGIWDACLP